MVICYRAECEHTFHWLLHQCVSNAPPAGPKDHSPREVEPRGPVVVATDLAMAAGLELEHTFWGHRATQFIIGTSLVSLGPGPQPGSAPSGWCQNLSDPKLFNYKVGVRTVPSL